LASEAGHPGQDMRSNVSHEAVVIGAGPNGLAAAITMARAGKSVCVLEGADSCGGCVRSDEGTLPGFIHDTCSAIYPMAVGTPFFSSIPRERFPVEWIFPQAPLAHPLDDGPCILMSRSAHAFAGSLGEDGPAYLRYAGAFPHRWKDLAADVLKPVLQLPRHPVLMALFGARGIWPAGMAARFLFRTPRARAFLAGMGAHSVMPLEHPLTSAFALFMCASAHATGWPIPRGGAGVIALALADYARSLGVEIKTSHPVRTLEDLPEGAHLFFDLTPRQILAIARESIPACGLRRLEGYRYGPGAFKVDWALDGPIPWRSPESSRAATLHLGGTCEEIALSERLVWQGVHPEKPFVILVQPSLFDSSRATGGRHTASAYCHVPNGSGFDMTVRIEAQVERFAPGFRDRILARRVLSPAGFERFDPNLVGGDIAGGANSVKQILFRPGVSLDPYRLGPGLSICSASSPPGGGVHGMCGMNASLYTLRRGRAGG
jgi:phytoene dehydrogenase-like protein